MKQPNLKFNPCTGDRFASLDWTASQFRAPDTYWRYNPWVASRTNPSRAMERTADDIQTDPRGLAIWEPDWGPMPAAAPATERRKGVMTVEEFNAVFERTIESARRLLVVKGGEYTPPGGDRLAQFTADGIAAGVTPLQCLLIYMSKHYGSFSTFVRDEAAGKTRERSEPIDGRLDDIINYCILAKAIIESNR